MHVNECLWLYYRMGETPNEFKLKNPPNDGISAVKFGGTSQFLLTSSWDTSVRLYDIVSNNMRLKYHHQAPVLDCCFYVSFKDCFYLPVCLYDPSVWSNNMRLSTIIIMQMLPCFEHRWLDLIFVPCFWCPLLSRKLIDLSVTKTLTCTIKVCVINGGPIDKVYRKSGRSTAI